MKTRLTPFLILLALFAMTAGPGYTQVFDQLSQGIEIGNLDLSETDINFNTQNLFGKSVSLDNDTVVISHPSALGYVFTRSADTTWTEQAGLKPADRDASVINSFAHKLSLAGDTIILGSPDDAAAYVFVRSGTTWSEQAKLKPADGKSDDRFDGGISLDGDTVVISSASVDDHHRSSSAYVFVQAENGTWSQQAKLMPAGGDTERWFGNSVSLDSNTVVIGAFRSTCKDRNSFAYVFVRAADGTWRQQTKLKSPDGVGDRFGKSASIDGDTVVIGSDNNAAYVFVRAGDGTWSEQAKLMPADGTASFGEGERLSLDGDTVVIGNDNNAAYVFVRAANNTWSQQAKLTASDTAASDRFGYRVSLDGDTIVIGSDNNAVYVFVRAGDGTWSEQAKLTAPDVAKPTAKPSDR